MQPTDRKLVTLRLSKPTYKGVALLAIDADMSPAEYIANELEKKFNKPVEEEEEEEAPKPKRGRPAKKEATPKRRLKVEEEVEEADEDEDEEEDD